jgi:hypothetical protein
MKPVRARKIQWWREPEFARRRIPPPQIPPLVVDIAMDDGSTEIVRKNQRAMSRLVQSDIDGC